MKSITVSVMVALVHGAVFAQATVKDESLEAYNKRMEWFAEATYGMFIHFGLYSQLGGIWNGKEANGYAEWIQSRAGIPKEQYEGLLKTFNPVKFDAELIVGTAKKAGMAYLVITAKHHEGFCLWDSAYTEYDVKSTPFKDRDILGELKAACAKQGIRFGVYYSIMDWHHPSQSGLGFHNKMLEGKKQEYVDYQKNQILELIKKYDPAVLWFDADWAKWWTIADGIDLYNAIRDASPTVITNNRVVKRGVFDLDYVTQEQKHFKGSFAKHWEGCYTMNNSWGYKKNDSTWKSPEDIYQKLQDITSKGGNLLLNVGPDGNGEVQKEAYDILLKTAELLKAKPVTKNIPKITSVPRP
jgi:alpha-L-fucosidase